MGLKGCFFTISTIIVALCIVPLLVNGLPVTREASKKSTFCSLPWNRKTCESLSRPFAKDPTNPYVALPPWPGKSQQVFSNFVEFLMRLPKRMQLGSRYRIYSSILLNISKNDLY